MEIGTLTNHKEYEFNSEGKYRISGCQWLSGARTNKSKKRYCTIREGRHFKRYPLDLLIYSVFKNGGEIYDGEIHHKDGDEENNALNNLQTDKVKDIEPKKKKRGQVLQAFNTETEEKLYFNNMNQASKHFKCSPANLHYIMSRNGGDLYGCIRFEYVDKDDDIEITGAIERKTKYKNDEERKNAVKESIKRSIEKKKQKKKEEAEQNNANSILKYL